MTDTIHLGLPLIEAAQAQKHVTHNEALVRLDSIVQLSVLSRALSAPPSTPADGDRHIVHATGTGGFAGKDNQVALYSDGGWQFYPPQIGWIAFVADEGNLVAWDGSAWVSAISSDDITELQNLTLLGIGTTADSTNPLSAKLNNALWVAKTVAEGGDGNLRYKFSKESAAKTLSLLFQNNFSGRAEIGLTGDDDFHFKVSPDGSTWTDALIIDKSTGSAKLNTGFFLTGDISPAQITADQNDYNPTGLSTASVLRLSSDASRNITGLSGGGDGRVIAVANVGTSNLVFIDANTGSSAGNRFAMGADLTLAAKQSALFWYDATDTRWKILAAPRLSFSNISGTAALAQGGTNADLSASGGASQVLKQSAAGAAVTVGLPLVVDVQQFTSSGTWTKPAGALFAYVEAWGGGGGGGGGARTASGNASAGGGGGGGGSGYVAWMAASSLGATETVTIGAGGSSGAGATSDGNAGSNGSAGGTTSFGSWLSSFSGGGGAGGQLAANSGGGGGGGSLGGGGNSTGSSGGSAGGGAQAGGSGSSGGSSGGYGAGGGGGCANGATGSSGGAGYMGSGGGAAGGGVSTTPGQFAGGNSGRKPGNFATVSGGAAGGSPGSTPASIIFGGGSGGSGGGSNITGTGGAGGAGSTSGGGGGGGSAVSGIGGAGGAGGAGSVRVITYISA